jgi:hypothetical protein
MPRLLARCLALATLAAGLARVGVASAEEPAAPPPARPAAPATAAAPSEKRALPDYDGREDETTAGDVAIWVPRVALYPAYLASEYVVRRPIGALMTAAERNRWIQEVTAFFTFGPNGNIGIVPTALLDFGLRSSVGVYFFYDDLGAPGNDLRVHAATGGSDWLRLTVADRVALDERTTVKFRAEGWRRPDALYYGVGPRSLEATRSRWASDLVEGGLSASVRLGALTLDASSAVRSVSFRRGTCCEDPSLYLRILRGELAPPPGYAEGGFTPYKLGLNVALDSRAPRPLPGTGARLELSAEHDIDLEDPSESRWIRYGATLGGFLDLTGKNRVVSLAVTALFADPLGDRPIPFPELVSLGGDAPMRGFLAGRLLGRSAAVATLEYRYPIWAFLDGSIDAALGNVFGEHLEGADPDLLRASFWAGVRTVGERDHSFDLLVGAGTDTFEQGGALNEARVVFGAKRGF